MDLISGEYRNWKCLFICTFPYMGVNFPIIGENTIHINMISSIGNRTMRRFSGSTIGSKNNFTCSGAVGRSRSQPGIIAVSFEQTSIPTSEFSWSWHCKLLPDNILESSEITWPFWSEDCDCLVSCSESLLLSETMHYSVQLVIPSSHQFSVRIFFSCTLFWNPETKLISPS